MSGREGAVLPLTEDEERALPSDATRRLDRPRSPAPRPLVYNVLVRDIMTRDVVVVRADEPVREAARRMHHHHISGLPVVDAKQRVVGVVSETDLGRVLGSDRAVRTLAELLDVAEIPPSEQEEGLLNRFRDTVGRTRVEEIMTPGPIVIQEGETAEAAFRAMREHRVNRLPVVRRGRLVGILSRDDLLSALLPDVPQGLPK